MTLLLLGWGFVCAPAARAEGPGAASAEEMMAQVAARLPKFVRWPDGCFAGPEEPLRVLVLGDPAMAEMIKTSFSRQRYDGRGAVVTAGEKADAASKRPHVVWIGRWDRGTPPHANTVRALLHPRTLVICAGERCTDTGALFGLTVRNWKIAIDANMRAIAGLKLSVSSHLLRRMRQLP